MVSPAPCPGVSWAPNVLPQPLTLGLCAAFLDYPEQRSRLIISSEAQVTVGSHHKGWRPVGLSHPYPHTVSPKRAVPSPLWSLLTPAPHARHMDLRIGGCDQLIGFW